MASNFIPNSFQHPNIYVDKYMPFLTDKELRVLIYMMRRIFGFHKRQDHISLSQITDGIFNAQGERLDYGAGLSRPAAVKAISGLAQYRIIEEVAENDPATNCGKAYALELDEDMVDFEGLQRRKMAGKKVEERRTRKGREAIGAKRELVNAINQQDIKERGQCDLPPLVNAINPPQLMRLTHNIQVETQKETQIRAAKSNVDFSRGAEQQSLLDEDKQTVEQPREGSTSVDSSKRGAKSKQPSQKPPIPREPDLLFDAIAAVWNTAPGMTGKIKQQLTGNIPAKHADAISNFDEPATPDEVQRFAEWYAKKCIGCDMPLSRVAIQTHFYAFRRAHAAQERQSAPKVRYQNGRKLIYNSDSQKWYDVGPDDRDYQEDYAS